METFVSQQVRLQDQLTGALIGLVRACQNNGKTENTDRIIIEGLFTTNGNANEETLRAMIEKVHAEKSVVSPGCDTCAAPCGNTDDYDMNQIWNAQEDIRTLKSQILYGIRGMAADAYHAMALGYTNPDVNNFFHKALAKISYDLNVDALLPVVTEAEEVKLKCKELLDQVDTAKDKDTTRG